MQASGVISSDLTELTYLPGLGEALKISGFAVVRIFRVSDEVFLTLCLGAATAISSLVDILLENFLREEKENWVCTCHIDNCHKCINDTG